MSVPARSESTTPTDGVQNAPRILSLSRNGRRATTWSGVTQLGLDAPGPRRRHPPAQLLHPLLGAGDLEAAGLGEHAQLLVLAHRVEGEVGQLAGVVDREDEVRRVTGGAAGIGQRALVDLDDVPPAEAGEVVDEAVADDARADHARPGRWRERWPCTSSPLDVLLDRRHSNPDCRNTGSII